MAASEIGKQFIDERGFIGGFPFRLVLQAVMSLFGVFMAVRWFWAAKGKHSECRQCKDCKGQKGSMQYPMLIAGFAEVGEAVEDTVRREVMEEVGVKVKNIRYYKSQPWPFSDTLLLGFFCELDGNKKIILDKKELSEAEWIAREDMEMTDDGISLTYEMMDYFKNNKEAF